MFIIDHVYNRAVQQPDYGCVQFLSSICCPQAHVFKVDWQLYAIDNCCSTSFRAVLKSLSLPWLSFKLPCGEIKNHSQGLACLWARKTRREERKKRRERELADWVALPSPQRDFSFRAETVVSFVSISPSEPVWKMKLVDVRKAPVSCHTHAAAVTAFDCLV